jgi:uncharacterized protein
MLEIVKTFLKEKARLPIRQSGSLKGEYYERSGSCNQCGKCCTNIYLVHGEQTIDSIPLFEELKQNNPDYESFEPVASESDGSVLFQCRHLQADKTCGIYDQRPDFCRRYPSEQGLLMGGKLAPECGYKFRLLKTFEDVLAQLPSH